MGKNLKILDPNTYRIFNRLRHQYPNKSIKDILPNDEIFKTIEKKRLIIKTEVFFTTLKKLGIIKTNQ